MNKVTAIVAVILLLGATAGGTWMISYEQAYEEGYGIGNDDGYDIGQDKGYTLGKLVGNQDGFVEGNARGYETGYDEGSKDGYSVGRQTGWDDGYIEGNSAGQLTGYREGYDVGFDLANETAYIRGVIDGVGRGYNLRDPTFSEARAFVRSDKTDRHKYIEDVYTCRHYSRDFIMNAENEGYHCFYVFVGFESGGAHALIAFNTTDRGILYIESQNDRVMKPKVGNVYWNRKVYTAPDYDDTIDEIMLIG